MLRVDYKMFAIILATAAATLWSSFGQAQLLDEDDDLAFGRPWPTYSLQNMPKTQFTCHDKILGGYYADPETQCQMFHVCVKLPGIGVQDYRFLCPNTTAFDQELQICANWADVDCDKATSYYDNNNLNDLYRDGDSKSANEEEATFHLQRAETGDVRRSKEQSRGDQKSRQRHNYGSSSGTGSSSSSSSSSSPNLEIMQSTKRPISSYYTPTTSSTTTSTTSTTERNYYSNNNNNYGGSSNNNDDSKQDFDDIFKGSHSSHFFSNRQGGREYDEESSSSAGGARPKPNDFSDYNRKTTEASSKSRVTPTRGQRLTSSTAAAAPSTSSSSTSKSPLKKITLHASFNTDFLDYTPQSRTTTTPRPSSSITSRFSFGSSDYQTQERIQPTTYNPNSGAYRYKSTPPPKYTEQPSSSTKLTGKNVQDYDKETTKRHKPTVAARKQKLGPQESNYINHNEFVDVPKSRVQQPQPFQATQNKLEPHYQRPKQQQTLSRVGSQEPAPFKASSSSGPSAKPRSFTSRGSITYKATTERYVEDELRYPTTPASAPSPAAVKKVTLAARDSYTPTTFKPTTYKKSYEQNFHQAQQTPRPSQGATKKVSTVAGGLPTTANPYYNVDEDDGQYHPELYENDFPRNRFKFLRTRASSSTSTTTPSAPPASSRQPHGFQQAHSHLKSQQQSAYQKERDSDLSDEDELFKTAQSLNFGAASINKLRADIYKAEKTSQQYNSQYSPQLTPSSPKTTAQTTSRPTTYSTTQLTSTTTTTTSTTTRRPSTTKTTTTTSTTSAAPHVEAKKSARSKKEKQLDKKERTAGKRQRPPYADEDTSYDYAYYDTD